MTIAELTGVLRRAEDASAELGFTRSDMMRYAEALRSGKMVCEPPEMAEALTGWIRKIDAASKILRREVGSPLALALGVPQPPGST